jgi:hypothetical protein
VSRGDEGLRRTLAGQEDQAFNGKKIQTKRLTLAAEAGFGSKMSRMSTVDDGQKGNEFKWGLVTKHVHCASWVHLFLCSHVNNIIGPGLVSPVQQAKQPKPS